MQGCYSRFGAEFSYYTMVPPQKIRASNRALEGSRAPANGRTQPTIHELLQMGDRQASPIKGEVAPQARARFGA